MSSPKTLRIEICNRKKEVIAHTIVDAEDAWVGTHRWCLCHGYATRNIWNGGDQIHMSLHRVLMQAPAGMHIDHINGDKLDNRRENLRVVTRSQNMQNRQGADRRSKTGVRGVFKHSKNDSFYAQVGLGGKIKHVGSFASIEDASRAVEKARAELGFMDRSGNRLKRDENQATSHSSEEEQGKDRI